MAAAHLMNPETYVLKQFCTKIPLPGRQQAQKAVRRHRKNCGATQQGAGILNAYKCRICGAWHIGHR